MDEFAFWPNVKRGFAQGVGLVTVYIVLFVGLALLARPKPEEQNHKNLTIHGGAACSRPWA